MWSTIKQDAITSSQPNDMKKKGGKKKEDDEWRNLHK